MHQIFLLHFAPLLPLFWFSILGGLACTLASLMLWRSKRKALWRSLTLGVFLLTLANPVLQEEHRTPLKSIVTVIVDDSPSQSLGERKTRTVKALEALKSSLSHFDSLDVRVVHGPKAGSLGENTNLFQTLEESTRDIPENRRAGTFLITDGQVHDAPQTGSFKGQPEPLHVLLTGDKNETDRKITLLNAPAFGLVGENATVTYKIEDTNAQNDAQTTVTLSQAGSPPKTFLVPIGTPQTLTLPVQHAGQNVFSLSVASTPAELTNRNNRAVVEVQGVRDRLKVLLVSGKPHAGARVWRDLLTSDPAVDLVHFTILREPDKIDSTPPDELSLIPFPFEELFQVKLYDFDLVIFDSYRLNRLLPDQYFENIARYVQQGGAFLEVSGPDYAGENSLYHTPLRNILPAAPQGPVLDERIMPTLTTKGQAHPVTRDLPEDGPWGPWLRQIPMTVTHGDVLMTGKDQYPLLILDRVQQGRVAQIASDQIWLWAKGFEGGGPHTALMRRLIHWLMKEPQLDEKALDVRVDGARMTMRRANYNAAEETITLTKPDNTEKHLALKPDSHGFLSYSFKTDQTGLHSFTAQDGETRFAMVGPPNPPEFQDLQTTDKILGPIAEKTGGGVFWLSESSPNLHMVQGHGVLHGPTWAGLRDPQAYTITGLSEKPLFPFWFVLMVLGYLVMLTWWKEGRH